MERHLYDNRELSWLKFNKRVLEEAEDKRNPLCERLSFLSIFQSNLDEFVMVREGSLYAGIKTDARENKTNMTCLEQLRRTTEEQHKLLEYKDSVYKRLMSELEGYGIAESRYNQLIKADQDFIHDFFLKEIRPFISPQVVGKRQPFPFLRNKGIYAVVELRTKADNIKMGIIPCFSPVLKRMVPISDNGRKFMLVEEVILHYVDEIFDKYQVKSKSLIRIIRSAEIDVDEMLGDEETDYRKAVEAALKFRNKLNPLRIEFSREIDHSIVRKMCDYLKINKERVFHSEAPIDLSFLYSVQDLLRNDKRLFYDRRVPQQSAMIDPSLPVMDQIRNRDLLLSYPYESMKPFINLLNEAAADPNVVSIKMTLYRLASNSKVIEALTEAAENGKEVVVLVELRARFDEENNIRWSRQLEESGCRVIYGLNHLKVHSKLCLITSKINNMPEYITQIGTGNYNEKTSKLYTDYSLMTSSPQIGSEAAIVFDHLAMGKTVDKTKHLLVAPNCLQNKVLDMIDEEIKKAESGEAYIGIKINSLTDRVIIDKLIDAGKAGVKIDMIVRGICCLKAGVPGETDNINVISIVGRFLEHSRIYIFGKNKDAKVYIGSADFMSRNTTRRVEIAAPVYDEEIKQRLISDFNTYLSDDVKARVQTNGVYSYKQTENNINAQEYLYSKAYGENGDKSNALL